jgi:DNA recombination protein RmuC
MEPYVLDLPRILSQPLLVIGNRPVSLGEVLTGLAVALGLLLCLWLVSAIRAGRRQAIERAAAAERQREAEMRMAELIASQNEITGRMAAMSEHLGTRQADLARLVAERLDAVSGRMGQSLADTTRTTQESLARLQERLAVIDSAQNNIAALTGQVVQLQNILANKQQRGAFGEARMAAIVSDGLPQGAYEFQYTLSNGARPDCIVRMPNDTPPLVIDAKFPLESWNAIRDAGTPEREKIAQQQFRRDIETHIRAIADSYFLPGETQDTAFMFVPSESVFAEIHEKHEALVSRAHKSRIVIVSPSLLMLSIQVIQSVLKDHRMREQAHLIQGEVMRLMEDVNRLDERVRKLGSHFAMVGKDVDDVLTSTGKLARRGAKIADLDFEEQPEPQRPRLKAVD